MSSDIYRVDWWIPLVSEPGEWAGRWETADTAAGARSIAIHALATGAARGLALLTLTAEDGTRLGRTVADAEVLQSWSIPAEPLPQSRIDPADLPPLGREDLEILTLSRCREALLTACQAELLRLHEVSAIIDIVHQAFAGIGPAAELAALIEATPTPGCRP